MCGSRETGPQKLCATGVPAQHAIDFAVRHRHPRSGCWIRSGPERPVGSKAVVDAAEALLGAVVCGADEIELAEQGVELQKDVVPLAVLDALAQGDQQVFRRLFLGGEDQAASPLELSLGIHGAILGSGGRTVHARRSVVGDYLQVTVTVNGLVI